MSGAAAPNSHSSRDESRSASSKDSATSYGELTFLGAKLAVGAFAAYILYRCAHLPIAKRGLDVVLGIYVILMLVHVATGCVAVGWQTPIVVLGYVESLPNAFLSLFV